MICIFRTGMTSWHPWVSALPNASKPGRGKANPWELLYAVVVRERSGKPPAGHRAGSEPLATNNDAVLCCAAEGACKQQAKYKRRQERAESGITSTSGNPYANRRSGTGAVQHEEKITSPNN